MKKCTKCGIEKPLTEYHASRKAKSGKREKCKICVNDYNLHRRQNFDEVLKTTQLKWRNNNKEKVRNNYFKRTYGIEIIEYDKLSEKQNHKCKICNLPETTQNRFGNIKKLSVDHCHVTGKVRGLLCYPCNVGIGFFKDNENLLMEAINYLKKNKE